MFNTSPKIKNEFTGHCFYLNGVKNGAVGINENVIILIKNFTSASHRNGVFRDGIYFGHY